MKRLIVSAIIATASFAVPTGVASADVCDPNMGPCEPVQCDPNMGPCEPAPCDPNMGPCDTDINTGRKIGHQRHALKFASR